MSSKKGISLIASVITIITLLILAGIIYDGELSKTNHTTYELERNQYCPTCGRRY